MSITDKRNNINWEEKNNSDDSRISKRIQNRNTPEKLDDFSMATTTDEQIFNPEAPEQIEEKQEEYKPFFNISLMDENEILLDSEKKSEREILKITKQQTLMSQRNLMMDSTFEKKADLQQEKEDSATIFPDSPILKRKSGTKEAQPKKPATEEEEIAQIILKKIGRAPKKNKPRPISSDE